MKHVVQLVLLLGIGTNAFASRIEYSFGGVWYSAEKTDNAFVLRLSGLERKVPLTKCSTPKMSALWKTVTDHTKSLQLTTKNSKLSGAADLFVDGEKRQILQFEPGFEFFHSFPQDATVAILETEKKCGK